jgi:hypothetical protein
LSPILDNGTEVSSAPGNFHDEDSVDSFSTRDHANFIDPSSFASKPAEIISPLTSASFGFHENNTAVNQAYTQNNIPVNQPSFSRNPASNAGISSYSVNRSTPPQGYPSSSQPSRKQQQQIPTSYGNQTPERLGGNSFASYNQHQQQQHQQQQVSLNHPGGGGGGGGYRNNMSNANWSSYSISGSDSRIFSNPPASDPFSAPGSSNNFSPLNQMTHKSSSSSNSGMNYGLFNQPNAENSHYFSGVDNQLSFQAKEFQPNTYTSNSGNANNNFNSSSGYYSNPKRF